MRVLFLGDIMGRSGRSVITEELPGLKEKLKADFVIINGENAASGFGLTQKIANGLIQAGGDVISGGNHTFDQKEISIALDQDQRILRPANYPPGTPGRGHVLVDLPNGKKVLVINLMGRIFMHALDCPFRAVDQILTRYPLGGQVSTIIVDMHGEATSEKMAMGQYLDGRVSLVVGTHSHIPTADAQILDGGTAYQTDAGMCGDYNSVIGMDKNEPIQRFLTRLNKDRFTPATGPGTLCGVFVDIDDRSGKARHISPVRIGPRLANQLPDF